jgi:mono/diheme cytochrome c family protein
MDQTAPPVTALSASSSSTAQLTEGRSIYLGQCVRCHAAEPIKKYSSAQWATILPEMMDESKLSPEQRAAVTAYVQSVLRLP